MHCKEFRKIDLSSIEKGEHKKLNLTFNNDLPKEADNFDEIANIFLTKDSCLLEEL